ncbi:methyltransferase domain-containing protein [Actinokineospora sp. 24-640]
MTTDSTLPQTNDVSDFYDIVTQVLIAIWGENFHVGYWTSEADDSSDLTATERMTDLLIAKLALTSDDRVLDIGCGIGVPTLKLAKATGATAVGVSVNPAEIAQAKRITDERGMSESVTFDEADAHAMPYPDASFDAAWAIESLLHMDRAAALREVARVLKPGGTFVITDLLRRGELSSDERTDLENMALSEVLDLDGYRSLLIDSPLELVEVTDIGDHTMRTHDRMAALAKEKYDELIERFGTPAEEIMGVMTNPVRLSMVLAVVRRPA